MKTQIIFGDNQKEGMYKPEHWAGPGEQKGVAYRRSSSSMQEYLWPRGVKICPRKEVLRFE